MDAAPRAGPHLDPPLAQETTGEPSSAAWRGYTEEVEALEQTELQQSNPPCSGHPHYPAGKEKLLLSKPGSFLRGLLCYKG